MTPKEQWLLSILSNAPAQTVDQIRYKAELILEVLEGIEPPEED